MAGRFWCSAALLIASFVSGIAVRSAVTPVHAASNVLKGGIVHVDALLHRDRLAFHSPGGWVQPIASSSSASVALIKQTSVAPHSHFGPDEFVYVINGNGTASIGGHEALVHGGDLILVPRGVVHAFDVEKGMLNVLVFFSPPMNYNDVHWAKR